MTVEPKSDLSGRMIVLKRIVALDAHDTGLTEIAARLRQPILLPTERFGTLRYERRYGWFVGPVAGQLAPAALVPHRGPCGRLT